MLKLLIAAGIIVLIGLGALAAPRPSDTAAPTPVVPSAAAGEQTIEITESMLDDVLSHQLVGQPLGSTPLGAATLKRVQTHLTNGEIRADGDAAVGSSTVPVSVSSRVDVSDGHAIVTVQDARAAGMPVPDSTRSSVQKVMQSELDQQVQQAQLRIKSVAVTNGKLVIVGTRTR